MKNKWLRLLCILSFALSLAIIIPACSSPSAPTPTGSKAPASSVAPQSLGSCEECVGGNCYSSTCNHECIQHGSWCETIDIGAAYKAYTPDMKANGGDYAEFICQRVMKNNSLMEAAGVKLGDTITHVNDQFPGWKFSDSNPVEVKFADLILKMVPGMRLRIIRGDNTRIEITL